MNPQLRITKTIKNTDQIISVTFEYIETYDKNTGSQNAFITKINNELQFNYIFKKVDAINDTLDKFLIGCGSKLLIFDYNKDDDIITKYNQKDINLTYKDFIEGDDVMTIQEKYLFN